MLGDIESKPWDYRTLPNKMLELVKNSMIEQIDLAIKTMEGRKLANRDDDSFIKLDF